MKPTVSCLLHLDERNNCCRSVTIFSSDLLSLIDVVKVSRREKKIPVKRNFLSLSYQFYW